MKDRIYLFDTTLRDGQQTPGIDFSVEDKIAIAGMLDEFGLDYVEGGYPGANYLVRATALVNGSPVVSNTLPLTITAAVTPPVAGATPVPATGWLGLLLLSLGIGAAGLMGRKRQPR